MGAAVVGLKDQQSPGKGVTPPAVPSKSDLASSQALHHAAVRRHQTRAGSWDGSWPPVPGTSNQPGWGGLSYLATSAPVTSVTASFTVPSLTGDAGSDCSIWVGIGNVMQTCIYSAYNTGYPGNNDTICPWTWFIQGNGASELWDVAAYPVKAGDSMTLTLALTGNYWVATQVNATSGWTATSRTSVQAVGIATSAWGYPFNTAEIIIEKEGTADLPNYGSLTFSNIAATPAIVTADLNYINTVNTNTDQTAGTYANGSYTMTWNNYS